MTTRYAADTVNGLDTRQIFETVTAVQKVPGLAKFQFRASNVWIDSVVTRSRIQGFFGVGREDDSRERPFQLMSGEPPALLGENQAPNPGEFLLHALAACVTTTTVIHAAARGIKIRELTSEIEGDVDLRGFLGLADVRPGFEGIRMKLRIDADCTPEQLDELMRFARGHSAVYDSIAHPVPVKLDWVRAS